ncbi:hypothetical protein SGO26_30485 (plasmid) [Cupriavidus metallidurans]|nr:MULTISPECIES: hypothetical protein [Cupriavidus]
MSTFESFDCPECGGKETVKIMPTAGGRGTGEATSYAANCAACNRTLAEELPSNSDGKRATATRELKRILARWPEEKAGRPRVMRTPPVVSMPSGADDRQRPQESAMIKLADNTFKERDLLERAMRNLRAIAPRRGEIRWVLVHQLFSTGSTVSAAICREFGYDPDEKVKP